MFQRDVVELKSLLKASNLGAMYRPNEAGVAYIPALRMLSEPESIRAVGPVSVGVAIIVVVLVLNECLMCVLINSTWKPLNYWYIAM